MIETGLYRHYKGNLYKVLGIAKHSETLEDMVLYEALVKPGLWVRPLQMFTEHVIVDGERIPRFRYLGKAESHLE